MIETDNIIDFYIDVFGNEIDVYEEIQRYTVGYKGKLFDGDTDKYNEHNFDNWDDAIALYNRYGDMISIKDNKYGNIFMYGDWM